MCYISPQKEIEKLIGNQEKRISFEAICGSPRAKLPQDEINVEGKKGQNDTGVHANCGK